jgi:hypothetical protein
MSDRYGYTLRAVLDVHAERTRQHERHGEQNLPNGTADAWDQVEADAARQRCDRATATGSLTWRHVLEEEVSEALAEVDPEALRAELVQVAAVAIQWIEALDRRAAAR